ncbi:Aminopeptidase C [Corynebacterium pseudotuberculosis 267]|uniref:C1 family peptidase n=1 Tax=Corynebacterium pseudotuberculosis TaxID=1719 RepID=UPI0002593C7C|nr:C1 family peptidase [Corynebacterium pseudotuberculosis]AFH51232.1 Aminopeptidase C [Corynebacterium pseudotuberculosis 267]
MTELTMNSVSAINTELLKDPTLRLARNAVAVSSATKVALNREAVRSLDTSVSTKVDSWTVANQKKSGRCWIFAGLNSLRGAIMKETAIKDFELSQTYIHFWDKVEKANYFLCAMDELRDRDLTDRTVEKLLHDPIDDGGQWNMFVALVQKYGVVPQYAMPETFSSSNTYAMNRDLASVLRRGALRIRDGVPGAREEALESAFKVITTHLGVPPETFQWQYRTKDDDFVREGTLTPLDFAQRYLPDDLGDYVCVVNDPRNAFGELYTVEYLGNVVGAPPVTYVNAPIEVLRDAVRDSLIDATPVWFGCDTEVQAYSDAGLWDAHLFDYEGLYGVNFDMSKTQRLLTGDSLMTHAMVFTGMDLAEDGTTVNRWRVENSWGTEKADKGFWTMSDSWFEEYVFEVAVPRSAEAEEYRQALTKTPHVLPAWDPMGALA